MNSLTQPLGSFGGSRKNWFGTGVLGDLKIGPHVYGLIPQGDGSIIHTQVADYLSASFDGNTDQSNSSEATVFNDYQATVWIGKDWSGINKKLIRCKVYATNNYGFSYCGSNINFYFEGSNDGSSWTIIGQQLNVVQTNGMIVTIDADDYDETEAYTHHRVRLTGMSRQVWLTEVEFYTYTHGTQQSFDGGSTWEDIDISYTESGGIYTYNWPSDEDGDMIVLHCNSLEIKPNAILTTSDRCRGLLIYTKDDCIIDGELTMTSRGCYADPAIGFKNCKNIAPDPIFQEDRDTSNWGIYGATENNKPVILDHVIDFTSVEAAGNVYANIDVPSGTHFVVRIEVLAWSTGDLKLETWPRNTDGDTIDNTSVFNITGPGIFYTAVEADDDSNLIAIGTSASCDAKLNRIDIWQMPYNSERLTPDINFDRQGVNPKILDDFFAGYQNKNIFNGITDFTADPWKTQGHVQLLGETVTINGHTLEKITDTDTISELHRRYYAHKNAPAGTYRFECRVYGTDSTRAEINFFSPTDGIIGLSVVDLITGNTYGDINAVVTDEGNGVYNVVITGTSSTIETLYIYLGLKTSDNATTYIGTGTEGVYFEVVSFELIDAPNTLSHDTNNYADGYEDFSDNTFWYDSGAVQLLGETVTINGHVLEKITDTTDNVTHFRINKSFQIPPGYIEAEVLVYKGDYDKAEIALWNETNDTIGSGASILTDGSDMNGIGNPLIQDLGNGLYKYIVHGIATVVGTRLYLKVVDSVGTNTFAGTGTSGTYYKVLSVRKRNDNPVLKNWVLDGPNNHIPVINNNTLDFTGCPAESMCYYHLSPNELATRNNNDYAIKLEINTWTSGELRVELYDQINSVVVTTTTLSVPTTGTKYVRLTGNSEETIVRLVVNVTCDVVISEFDIIKIQPLNFTLPDSESWTMTNLSPDHDFSKVKASSGWVYSEPNGSIILQAGNGTLDFNNASDWSSIQIPLNNGAHQFYNGKRFFFKVVVDSISTGRLFIGAGPESIQDPSIDNRSRVITTAKTYYGIIETDDTATNIALKTYTEATDAIISEFSVYAIPNEIITNIAPDPNFVSDGTAGGWKFNSPGNLPTISNNIVDFTDVPEYGALVYYADFKKDDRYIVEAHATDQITGTFRAFTTPRISDSSEDNNTAEMIVSAAYTRWIRAIIKTDENSDRIGMQLSPGSDPSTTTFDEVNIWKISNNETNSTNLPLGSSDGYPVPEEGITIRRYADGYRNSHTLNNLMHGCGIEALKSEKNQPPVVDGFVVHIPRIAGLGATGVPTCASDATSGFNGSTHVSGPGGGGSGCGECGSGGYSGKGGNATCFSGGAASGGMWEGNHSEDANDYGGPGTPGVSTSYAQGGAGNPGAGSAQSGTGGWLSVICGGNLQGEGKLSTNGTTGGNHSHGAGGGSGAGFILILFALLNQFTGDLEAIGGTGPTPTSRTDISAGNGGNGAIIGPIKINP